ncbi:MAG: toprim domain-containing protein [Oscillospiraceae bacterium]|nr:toprim domain-containing protein [Oscillospiraceae bacterium]
MSKNTANNYGDHSLKALKGPDQVRKRPGVIFGSDGIEGCQHSVFEILSNSIDEAREGYGKEIEITRFNDGAIEIIDKGRGVPIDYNKGEEKYNWELAFTTLYAGGKYDNNTGENYTFALGLNGLGLCATQFAAEYMEVTSDNGTWKYSLNFEQGFNTTVNKDERGFTKTKSAGRSGTRIKWKPDLDVFTDIDIPDEYFDGVLTRQAVVNDNLLFRFRRQNPDGSFRTKEYRYENGIDDYIREIASGGSADSDAAEGMGILANTLTEPQKWTAERSGKDRDDKDEYKLKLRCALVFSNKTKLIEHYHNSSWLEYGGSPDKALRQAMTSQVDAYLKNNNKYNKGETKINFTDIEDCLIFVSSNFSTQTSYENQTKKAINNKFIYEAMTDWLKTRLEIYFLENKDEAARLCEQILVNKRSRENAEKTRLNLKKKLAGNIDISNRVQKFVDCRSKDLARRELYIVEGDSALGAVKLARDAEFQAVIPVRGKILNCLKSSYDKIFKNEIITDIIKVLGCGVEVATKTKNKELSHFNLDNLRWNKVIICTDADVDGFQIRTLILTMLYRLTPTLIQEGFVYIAESPLFEITAKDETFFAYTETEKNRIVSKLGAKKFTLQRSKGLGENEPDMMSLTTMNPDTRRLIKVLPTDAEETRDIFDLMLGDNLQGRKEFISEFGGNYLEMADIS